MAGPATGTDLLAEIFPGRPESSGHAILEGWGPPETTHRWTVGGESRCTLPAAGADSVLVLDIKPYCDENCPQQTIMLAIDGRLLATVQLADQRALGFRLPAGLAENTAHILSFTHLNSRLPRAPAGLDHHGLPLGIMVISLRLYRLHEPDGIPVRLPAHAGSIAAGDLPRVTQERTGLPLAAFAERFECLGHNCEFGAVQRAFGAEPLGLLRFAAAVTHRLTDGLRHGFSGIGAADAALITVRERPNPEFLSHDERYYLSYATGRSPNDTTPDRIRAEHCRKLVFLQRKFLEDLHLGEKIFTISRIEPMTEPEALALYCALNLHGRNTLLWTLPGDPAKAGSVEQSMPRFLCGHLGPLDPLLAYASQDAWLSVMLNAYEFSKRRH